MLSDDLSRLATTLARAAGKGAGTPESLAETAKALRACSTRARLLESPRLALNGCAGDGMRVAGGGAPSQQIDWLATCFTDAIQNDGDIYLDAEDGLAMAKLLHGVADLCRDLEAGGAGRAPENNGAKPAGVINLFAFRQRRNEGDAS